MATNMLERKKRRLSGRPLLVVYVVVMILLTLIVNSIDGMRSRNRAAIVKKMQKVVRLEPILSAQEESSLREANSPRLFDGILKAEANSRRLLEGPVRVILRCNEHNSVALPDLSGLEQLDTLNEMNIWPAYISKSQLNRLPALPFVRKLRMANFLTTCSETCVVESADTQPKKPEFAWEGKDMSFLSRMPNLQELELRALWLRSGALNVVADLPQLEKLSLNRSDFPSDELPSLQRLRNLRVMAFWNTPKAMRSLEWLREMETLEELSLIGGGQIDGKMLEPLSQLPRLHTLRLDFDGLSDDAWPVLETFQNLRILTLSYTNWFEASRFSTDETNSDSDSTTQPGKQKEIPEFACLKSLEWLDITSESFYAQESLRALLASVPLDCKVIVKQDHLSAYINQLPFDIAGRLSGELRPDLQLPVEY